MIITSKKDVFGGVTVETTKLPSECRNTFEESLQESLLHWAETRTRGVWVKIALQDSAFVPILARYGFEYHHAQKDFLMMTKWLPEGLNTLPLYAHTHIGVGGVVEDSEGRILMMREKGKHGYRGWKFPGGLSDPREQIFETAAREVREETGIHAVGETVLLFRQSPTSQFPGVGDIYFVVSMSLKDPKNSEIKLCPHETEEARWFTLQEVEKLTDVEIAPFVKRIILQHRNVNGKQAFTLHKINFAGRKMNIFMADTTTSSM